MEPTPNWEDELPLVWEAFHDARNMLHGVQSDGLTAHQGETPRRLHDIARFAGEVARQAQALLGQVAPRARFEEVKANFADLPHDRLGQALLPPGSFSGGADPTDPRSHLLFLVGDRLVAGRHGERSFAEDADSDHMLVILNSVLACGSNLPNTLALSTKFGWYVPTAARQLATMLYTITGEDILSVVNFGPEGYRLRLNNHLSVVDKRQDGQTGAASSFSLPRPEGEKVVVTAKAGQIPEASEEAEDDALSTGIPINLEKLKAMGVEGYLTDMEITVLARDAVPDTTLEVVRGLLDTLNFERGTFLPPRMLPRTVRRFGKPQRVVLSHYSPETAAWVWRQLAPPPAAPPPVKARKTQKK